MTRTVRISEETAEIIQRQVDQGHHADMESAIAEAARLLHQRDEELELLEQSLVGISKADRGELLSWTPELLPGRDASLCGPFSVVSGRYGNL